MVVLGSAQVIKWANFGALTSLDLGTFEIFKDPSVKPKASEVVMEVLEVLASSSHASDFDSSGIEIIFLWLGELYIFIPYLRVE